jgi:hypothetical protein
MLAGPLHRTRLGDPIMMYPSSYFHNRWTIMYQSHYTLELGIAEYLGPGNWPTRCVASSNAAFSLREMARLFSGRALV